MSVRAHPRVDVFDRVLCAVDGSDASAPAVAQARRLVSPLGSLELVAVVDLTPTPGLHGAGLLLREVERAARHALEAAGETCPRARRELLYGRVVDRVVAEAGGANATLLVVGTHGRSRPAGILLGATATHALHRARCSVLVARPAGEGFPRAIVAGDDGSEHAAAAVDAARELAGRFDARLTVVAAEPGTAEAALVAASADADLLVVGSRGLQGLRALASVSERVAHRAGCSVLVVR